MSSIATVVFKSERRLSAAFIFVHLPLRTSPARAIERHTVITIVSTDPTAVNTRELTIDSVGAQGDGVSDNHLFVALTLPGERVRVEVRGDRAEALDILSPSPDRIAPACPHFGACGGCALQHWASGPYIAWKAEQIRLAL